MKKLIIITLLLGKTVFGFTQQNQLENLIKIMSNKNIVALGEGTHGTKEFNDVRIEIIKQLITQYGFRKICWENAYGNTYRLNQAILSNSDVKKALEQHMSAIWQTKEILDFLVWLQNYNLTTDEKVQLVGLDWNYLEESAKIVKEHFTSSSVARELYFCAKSQDNSWEAQNDTTKLLDINVIIKNATKGYLLTKKLLKNYQTTRLNPSLANALKNLEHGFYVLYQAGKQRQAKTRDEMIAEMLVKIYQQSKSTKIIVWAHNGHVAFKASAQNEKDANPGGMGYYLKSHFKSNYFAVGTLTYTGFYSATKDQVDTHSNVFQSYALSKLGARTWESLLSTNKSRILITSTLPDSLKSKRLSMRLIGFRPEDENSFTEETRLQDYYNAIIFISNTTPSQHISNNLSTSKQ